MLDRNYQPMTIDPTKLQIGLARTLIGGVDLGSIKDSGIEITSVIKEHYKGYPAQRHVSETESVTAIATVTAEEIGGVPVVAILTNLFNNLVTQTATTYQVEMISGFAAGGNLKLVSTAQILPELSLDFGDDWTGVKFKFECVGNNAQSLLTKSIDNSGRQAATTINKLNLSIGKPNVLIAGADIGAIQSAQITVQGTVKKVEKGYPRCTAAILYLESKLELTLVTEENSVITTPDCEVVLKQALFDGGYLEFKFPHCAITQDLSVAPKNDWLGYKHKILPFKTDTSELIVFERRA